MSPVKSKLGITLDVPEPQKLGRDRLADSAWAAAHYELPLVTADLGTATTFNVIKKGGIFCGGVIAAGMETGLKALGAHTAQLPKLELQTPERVIGRNTEGCMLSGAVYGTAALLDGVVASRGAGAGGARQLCHHRRRRSLCGQAGHPPPQLRPGHDPQGPGVHLRLNKKEK